MQCVTLYYPSHNLNFFNIPQKLGKNEKKTVRETHFPSRVGQKVVQADRLEPAVQRGRVGDGVSPHCAVHNWSQSPQSGHNCHHGCQMAISYVLGPSGF